MKIRVDTLRVAGFRGLKDLEIFLPRIAVLIGGNNSGKTSLLKAMGLVLGDYSRYLSEEDFHIGADEKPVGEIVVDARIIPVDSESKRIMEFDDEWTTEFGDKIRSEPNGNQYVAFRTRSNANPLKGGFETLRYILEKWPEKKTWLTDKIKETKTQASQATQFISIEAQRDIHQELKEKTSFVGRVLAEIEYVKTDIDALEAQIKTVNDAAVNKSEILKNLKVHLERLNDSFQGSGNAEITPFPKKVRDLSKNFTVHLGEKNSGSFSMEYHGMGTRSWASMITVKAFTGLMAEKYKEDTKPFFPIMAAEEPEAHLHPSAQKTLYSQLVESSGQVMISTHSPYLAALAKQSELRFLLKNKNGIEVRTLSPKDDSEESRKLQRDVIHSKGEILFSRALVLCEGETEEQALPLLFQKYFSREPFELGVTFVGVGGSGKRYAPYLTLSRDFGIPAFIFSDGEPTIVANLKKIYEPFFGKTDVTKSPFITILDGHDFESYLLSAGFVNCAEAAIESVEGPAYINNWKKIRHGTGKGSVPVPSAACVTCKRPNRKEELRDYKSTGGHERALSDILENGKTKMAPALAEEICKLDITKFPPKIIDFFEKIKKGAGVP